MNNKSNQKTFKTDLHLLIPPEEMRSSNKVSLHQNNTKEIFLKKEYSKFNTFFNTFSSKTNTNESKSQKIFDKNLIDNKLKRINKAKSSNYKNIKSYIEEEKKKNSYLYLVKLKKYYSMQNFKNSNKSKYNSHHISSHNSQKIKSRISDKNEMKYTNNYYTINNFFINSKLGMTIDSSINQKNSNNLNVLSRNISNTYSNKTNEIKNDISEIINTRKKFNEIYNHFYETNKININENLKEINSKNNTCKYSTMNEYWNKRNNDNVKKINKLKNVLIEKGIKEIKSVPKINDKSKELAKNSNKKDNLQFNNIFEKLFQKKNSLHSHTYKKRINNKPKINEKSEKMIRTIDDLYLWNNKRQKKLKENEKEIYKKDNLKKKSINLTSEIILKERRPFYINKKVEDRLIEQGKYLRIKNNKKKEKYIKELTAQKIYKNNIYNNKKNIKSKYKSQEESKNEDINNNSNIKKNTNLFNFNYDYSITAFNKRNALFNKNRSNIIKELNEKINKNKNLGEHSKTLLLPNYMGSKINQNRNNVKILYNITDLNNHENKKENILEDKEEANKIEELKSNLINNNSIYEKNKFSTNKNINYSSNSDRNQKEKNKKSNIFLIKDKRIEDIKKIIDFSDKLYKK